MRALVLIAALGALSGCAGDYSKAPEPVGEWIPANPPGMMTEAAPAPAPRRVVWHRRVRRPTPVHTAAAQ